MRSIAVASLILALAMCSPKQRSNLGVDSLSGWTVDGKHLQLSQIQSPAVILNFYSPICKPCIDELPALEQYYDEATERGVPMFLAIEPDLERNGIEGVQTTDQVVIRESLIKRVQEDVQRYGIRIPILILDPPFAVEPKGLVTGTPETLLFRTGPFRLYYNFIGPLSTAKTKDELSQSSRYKFAFEKLEETVKNDSYRPREGY